MVSPSPSEGGNEQYKMVISRNKKKKGKKIDIGIRVGIPNNTKGQFDNCNTLRNCENKVPRKIHRDDDKTGKKNFDNRNWRNMAPQGKKRVLARIQKPADEDAIRAALKLKSQFPEKLITALGPATLELNHQYQFVIEKEAVPPHYRIRELEKILQKNGLPGWLEWLQGRRGWVMQTQKLPYLDYHRNLHEAYTDKMKSLLKEVDDDKKKILKSLYYKQDPLTQENGGKTLNGKRQNTQTIWKKVSNGESLQDAVGMIRPFLEVIKYFIMDPYHKWTILPWLMPNITKDDCRKRLNRISVLVCTLLRNSNWGPDGPVHWAAHPPLNSYPRSVVTPAIMTELVVGVANILSCLFLLPHPITVSNLDGVKKLLTQISPSGSATAQGGASSSGNSKKTTGKGSANHHQHSPSSDPVKDVIIDLTGLSIDD